jgi:hypothetical protein
MRDVDRVALFLAGSLVVQAVPGVLFVVFV